MAGCLISPVQEIGKCILTQCVWPPIKSHFDYWWCFDDNIQGLRDGIRDLKRQKDHIEHERDEARDRTDILCVGVEEWLKASTEKLEEAQKILLPHDNIPKACSLISRYSMGKNAKETAGGISKLLNDGNFNPIAYPAPPPAMAPPPPRSTTNFESRKGIEDEIIDSLKQSSVGMIGICGMGGVGKTTMAQRIRERVNEEDIFDEVVMVTVSQTIDMLKIQSEIAEWLNLKFDEKHISTRAAKLRTRLMDTKRKIIILDDVWDPSLKFEELGICIESNFERCKVLLTSRSRDTCKRFKNKVVFDLKILGEEEAWILFKEKAGKCVEDSNSDLHRVAKDVAKECKGLPIALVTVGIALQDEWSIYKWKDSLFQLKKSNPTDFPEVLTNVYKPLKLSYDYLENDSERYLFLMCCLFPDDYHIPIKQLTLYSMGLRLFDDVTNIEEARNRTHSLVEKLKSRSLLIASWNKFHVKMHDVVRDVAIYIGLIEKDGFLKSLTSIKNASDVNCNWMSVDISNEQMEVPVLSRFPKLRLLMLLTLSSNEFYDISHISIEGMEALNVLSFENISIRSLPPTLGSLENLQTLRLFDCKVENISVIGKLTSLKILSCCKCENITALPAEIGRLKDLRLLELNECRELQRIPFGIISSLFLLEELKIRRSFFEWETWEKRRNASLTELEHLRNLTCLEIEISDCYLSAQEIRLSHKLVRYRIWIAAEDDYCFEDDYDFEDMDYEKEMNLNRIHSADYDYYFEDGDYEKAMYLKLAGAVGNWIQVLARNAESLSLRGDGSGNINLAEMGNLRSLIFSDCSTVKKLVETSYISRCDNLARRCLLQLEVLEIRYCDSMEQVFWNEVTDFNTDGCIEFPKLKELRLENLPNLTAFCRGLENIIINFPNLTQMDIQNLPKLHGIFSLNSKDVSFCNLKFIYIRGCGNLRYLFSVSAARRCLLQLEVLQILSCKSMEQVFWNEGTDNNTDGCIEFPKLKKLRLENLPNLTVFCQGLENIIINFPNLTEMRILKLPKLNSLFPLNTGFHLFCNPKVEMGLLNNLTLTRFEDNIKNIWYHQIPNNFFNNLESLDINYMNGIRSLMSTSIAKNLVSLKYLRINNCEEMVEVIEIDDDNDKQVVDINCLFPNLRQLSLWNLHKLMRFWQCNHALELSLLETMNICNCPAMETFTLGSINTPNIREIFVNFKNIDHKDLNDVIRHT